MRRIVVEVEVSLDGGMGGENMDFFKQVFPLQSPDVKEYLKELLFTPDALLMGKNTYAFFAKVWPTRQGEDADKINSMPKYVASRTLKEPLNGTPRSSRGMLPTRLENSSESPVSRSSMAWP